MYQPPHFREERLEVQHALIRANPLGLLITNGPGGLTANPLPFHLVEGGEGLGRLKAHLARANPQWRDLAEAGEALVVFQGVDRYVTPSWYATKQETGKVVPTWNYAMVQVRGTVQVIEDADWLKAQVVELTAFHEAGRAAPWAVDDAPESFVGAQLRGIVGIEIAITSIDGKWKVSQNRGEADRLGVVAGLEAEPGEEAQAMASLVRQRGGNS